MAKEPTTVKETAARKGNGKTHNTAKVEFPQDLSGFTTLLRKEGTRAAGRIKGNAEKLDLFLNTLRVLAEHAKAKIEHDKAEIEKTLAAERNRALASDARHRADQKREIDRLQKQVNYLKSTLDGKQDAEEAE